MSEAGPASAPRRGRTPSADVERELLTAAEAVLVREGPGGLTVRAVAAEAGIAPMGVYNRLGGKDGLIDALLIRGFDRLRAAIDRHRDDVSEPSMRARFISCGLGYRQFALDNPHFYAIMFEDRVEHKHDSTEVGEHAGAAFGALVSLVELAAAAGVIAAPDPVEVAQQIWSAVHGAVALELRGMVLTPDPLYTYQTFLLTLMRGLAPR
ncbi:MAG TPA: TetR/AcrR family transcriptional regulator [Trebonia sp.]|jgi:AcrR family transcriptional regulator